jgi:hypothetical protein
MNHFLPARHPKWPLAVADQGPLPFPEIWLKRFLQTHNHYFSSFLDGLKLMS